MATNTKLETILKGTAKGKSFVLPLDCYTGVHYDREGKDKLYASTVRGIKIPLVHPLETPDPRLTSENQIEFVEALRTAKEKTKKDYEFCVMNGVYTADKKIFLRIKNMITLGALTTQENELLDKFALSYLAWSVLAGQSEYMFRTGQATRFDSAFYEEVSNMSIFGAKETKRCYDDLVSRKGFEDKIYKGDLDMYKISILSATREKKKIQIVSK